MYRASLQEIFGIPSDFIFFTTMKFGDNLSLNWSKMKLQEKTLSQLLKTMLKMIVLHLLKNKLHKCPGDIIC